MVFALLVLFAILALGVAGLSAAASGLSLSNNYRTGLQALHAAESGIVHGVAMINRNGGVTTFGNANSSTGVYDWTTFTGWSTPTSTMGSGYTNVSYTVVPSGDPNRDVSPWPKSDKVMLMTSVGQAPGESVRTVVAHLALSGPYSCGAIDMPSSGISASFQGNNFGVDGNDFALGANTPTAGSTPTLGISTRAQSDANTIVSALSSHQQDNVAGAQVPNQVASVGSCIGPTADRLRNQIVPAILSQPGLVTVPDRRVNGNSEFGTIANPQVTYFDGDTEIKANGNASGAGIMIVNGGLTIQGSLEFTGLIIVLGTTQITTVSGNASAYGAIWTTDLSLSVGGSAAVRYSTEALALANGIPSMTQQPLPQKANVVGWSQG